MLFSTSFKLALMCCSCLQHLLPWVASSSFVMHHAWLCIMSCLCVVCLPCCVLLLDSSRFVAIVRIRSSTLGSASSVRLLHGLVLLPCGISGKMTVSLDLTTIIAMLVASFYRYATYLSLVDQASQTAMLASNLFTLLSKSLLGYVTDLLSPSYSVVSCMWSWRLLHDGHDYVGISQYLLFN